MASFDLSQYDGVLASAPVIRELYLEPRLAERAWTWHEAADARVFTRGTTWSAAATWCGSATGATASAPPSCTSTCSTPVHRLGLSALVHGVRYPTTAKVALTDAGIRYGGWIANHLAPQAFAAHGVTVHVPRRPYVEALPASPPSARSRRWPAASRW
jgi:spore maturation protein CgeB